MPIQTRGVHGIREVCGRSTPLAQTARGLPIPANFRDLFPGGQVPSANLACLPGKTRVLDCSPSPYLFLPRCCLTAPTGRL